MSYDFRRYVEYMDRNGLDAIIASNYDITARMLNDYFTDLKLVSHGSQEYGRLVGCDRKGEMIAVVNAPNLVPWDPKVTTPLLEPRVRELAKTLKRRGLERGVIGLEMLEFPARGLLVLQDLLPNATFVDATWVVRQDMAVKTQREIRLIEKSVEICEAGFRNVTKHMAEALGRPVSELIFRYFAPEVNRLGGEVIGSNLISRPWEWYCATDGAAESGTRTEPVVAEGGTPINFDLLCGYQGLMCDIAFRAVVGEPAPEFVDYWDNSVKVKDALVESVKPGMTAGEAEAACLDAFRKAVGSAWDKHYWAVHSVGMHVHEFPQIGSPYIGLAGDYVFEPGMVLSVESIAEQAFLLEEDGMRRLGVLPMEIYRV